MTATSTTPTEAQRYAAEELLAMARRLDPRMTDEQMRAVDSDVQYGRLSTATAAAQRLRERAAELLSRELRPEEM